MSPFPEQMQQPEAFGAPPAQPEGMPFADPGMEPTPEEEQTSPQPEPPDAAFHLKLSAEELQKIASQIEQDFVSAEGDHSRRMRRWTEYYKRWRNLTDAPAVGEEDASNFRIPMTQWTVWQVWSQIMMALLGDDAEIVATPTGPSDQRSAPRVGKFMSWRLFSSMKIAMPLTVHFFRVVLFGRSFAYAPYVRRTYRAKDESGKIAEQVSYEGPGFEPQWPSDIIVPAEDVQNVQEFSFVIRRYWVTPQQLLQGERDGKYFDIQKRWSEIVTSAANRSQRDTSIGDELKDVKDDAEGVVFGASYSGRAFLQVWEWYGRRRLPKKRKTSPEENSATDRDLDETELVVRYLPASNGVSGIIGIQDLMDCYPHMEHRRPIVETALCADGSYWGPGIAELVENIEAEATVDHNHFQEAAEFAYGPLIFARPGMGLSKKLQNYGPKTVIETEDPNGVRVVDTRMDLAQYATKQQVYSAVAERVVGRTDLSAGRSIDRPNAPKTATGTVALLESGNIRVSMDMMVLREYLRVVLEHIWRLDTYFSPRQLFFRVTEEDAGGLWDDVRNGFATLTDEERQGNYDFDLKFATSVWSKAAKKQDQLALYQMDLQNPLIAMNAQALWSTTEKIHKAFGDDNFADIVPTPPMEDRAKTPKEEWNLALQGEDFETHPADNDDFHLKDHWRRVAEQRGMPKRDTDAINRMLKHIVQHEAQKAGKAAMVEGVQRLLTGAHDAADQQINEGANQLMQGGGQQVEQAPANGVA